MIQKVSAKISQHSYENRKTPVNFKGGFSDILTTIEAKPVLSLLVIDMFGMIIPRTVIDFRRNKEELGHPNWDAGRETFLREIFTACLMYFLPGGIAYGMGELLKNRYKGNVNTKSFISFNTLDCFNTKLKGITEGKGIQSVETVREKFVNDVIDSAYASMNDSKKIPDVIKQRIFDRIKDTNRDQKSIKEFIVKTSKEILDHFGESRIKVGEVEMHASHFVRDVMGFSDDLIMKASKDGKFDLTGKFEPLLKSLKSYKAVRLAVAISVAMSALIVFPIANIWLTKKISKNGNFPGVRGLDEGSKSKSLLTADKGGVVA